MCELLKRDLRRLRVILAKTRQKRVAPGDVVHADGNYYLLSGNPSSTPSLLPAHRLEDECGTHYRKGGVVICYSPVVRWVYQCTVKPTGYKTAIGFWSIDQSGAVVHGLQPVNIWKQ